MLKKDTKSLVKKFIKDSENTEITKHEGNFSPLVWGTAASLLTSSKFINYYKGDFGSVLVIFSKGRGIGFFDFNAYKRATETILEKYLRTKNFKEKKDYENVIKKIDSLYKKYNPNKLADLSDKELEKNILNNFTILKDWQVITLFCEALDEEITKKYFDKFNKANFDFNKFFEIATLVDFDSFFIRQSKTLLEYNQKNFYKSQWILANYLATPNFEKTEEKIKSMIDEFGGVAKIKKAILETKKINQKNKVLIKKYKNKLPGDLKIFFDFVKVSIEMRDVRKEFCFKTITLLSNSARELFKRLKISEKYLTFVKAQDFETGLFKNKNYLEILKKREKGVAVYYNIKGTQEEYVDMNKAKKQIFNIMDKNSKAEIKGNCACKGKAKAKAKIILSSKDFNKFKSGDILVTSMTRPEFVPLMKKASAVITDEGGITCHAAIISRELNVPCIIGTKNGSRFIKDGDLVEVDANIGIIKIIK